MSFTRTAKILDLTLTHSFMLANSNNEKHHYSNVNGTGSSANYYIYLSMNNDGVVDLENIHYSNNHIGQQAGFYAAGITRISDH